jgi:hypothetical protein
MTHAGATRKVCRGLVSAALALIAGARLGAAAEIRAIGAVHIVPSSPAASHRPVFPEERIRTELSAFLGRTCDPAAIAESLARRYRFLGYVPRIDPDCEAGSLSVTVRESSYRIDLITFDAAELSKIGVKPDRAFEEKERFFPVPPGAPRALLRGLLETRVGDLYNHERYRSDREALGRLGYAIVFIAGASPDPQAYPPGAYLIQSLTPPPSERPYLKRATNYLGGTGSYAPRAGSTVGLLYQKDEVFGRFDHLSVAPNYNASAGGDIAYRAPVLASRESPRRLYDIDLNLYSDFRHNRNLDGIETDERRSGIGGSIGFRPLELRAPNDLRFEIGLRHERVDLGRALPGESEESLTVVRLAATHEWRHTYRWPSLTTRLAPSIDISLDRAGGQRSFVRPSLDATMHDRSLSGFETDLHVLGGTLDRQTPPSELWSLGGPGTVRGFREDTFLGRHLAALQAELWVPLFRPGRSVAGAAAGDPSTEPPPFEPRAARLLRAALFVDGGFLSGTADGRNEAILGAGVGLRFVVPHQPLVIRIDYGWGLGGRGGESFPYLSLAYRF